MDTVSLIKERLTHALCPTYLEIIDQSHQHAGHAAAKGGGHYTITIVSSQFTGLTLVQRQKLVYTTLSDLMQEAIHALGMNTKTPEEFST